MIAIARETACLFQQIVRKAVLSSQSLRRLMEDGILTWHNNTRDCLLQLLVHTFRGLGSSPRDCHRSTPQSVDRILCHLKTPAATCALGIILLLSLVLAYELRITDFRTSSLELDKIVVRANQFDGERLIEYQGESLEEIVKEPQEAFFISDAIADFVSLLWVKLPLGNDGPKSLCNSLHFVTPSGEHRTVYANTDIHPTTQLLLSPPLRGGPWLAANGAANNDFHHRHTVFAKENEYYL
jgi:hypothetical protein